MTKKAGGILIVLSLPVLVIGALHFNMIMLGLDESREPITLAITGVGVLLLAVGVSGATRPRNGILVALVGAGIMTALFLRAKANGRRWHAEFESERAVKDAAEAVCNGTPHTAATASSVPRAIVSAGRSEEKLTTWYVHDWEGLPKPETAADLQLVACLVTTKATVASCSYGSGTTTSHIIFKVQLVETITVREARTAKQLATRSFEGPKPSDKCDESVRVSNRSDFSRDVSGGSPDHMAETAWLKTFVEAEALPAPATAEAAPTEKRCLPVVAKECGCTYSCGTGVREPAKDGDHWRVTHSFWKDTELKAVVERYCVEAACTDVFRAEIVCGGICPPKAADPTCHFDPSGACVGAP